MEQRYICQHCGTKWFVPANVSQPEPPRRCGACAGPLVPMPPPAQAG